MKVFITGYTGFLGNHLCNELKNNFDIIRVNLREIPENDSNSLQLFLDKFLDADIIINCVASIKPKTKNDIFINEDFPIILLNHLKKKEKKPFFIHISSINVLIDDRKDFYSITKKNAEKKLENENINIIRLPLVYQKINDLIQANGNFKLIHSYFDLNFLPFFPMIFPGHIHFPIEISKVSKFIKEIITRKEKGRFIYNIAGSDKKSLWDLIEEIAFKKNKKLIKINFLFLKKFLPQFIRNILIKNSSIFQQLVEIDHTNYKEKKKII